MIEIFRKGFRLDIPTEQIVTFKKSQNLNGIQSRYAYSNTISADKTANNMKLLELFPLPTGKVNTLQNGFTVDVILNGSIQLRNQTLNIQKETKEKVDLYLLYSDNALVVKLKEVYINEVAKNYKYKKTLTDFGAQQYNIKSRTAYVETQPKSGLYVIEEMPILIQLQDLIKLIFEQNGYTVYGDFFEATNAIKDYYVAPNKGVYQVYSGSGDGFSPTFDETLDAFKFLSDTLALTNSYAEVDDTYKTVVINNWANLDNYKTSYIDYSKYFVDYVDYSFQSKLAKRNEMTYSDSGTAYNSFFPNNLSSQDKATYLASAFGTGSINTFDDAEVEDDGTIAVRANGAVGEVSAIRIFKIGERFSPKIYINGVGTNVTNFRANPVSMRDVYTSFHKDYIDFIVSPLVSNIKLRYDAIVAATFSMTKIFFIEQLASYWIPLEINFSTKKDQIQIKAMLVKKRKVESPILNNFNSVLLNFKERTVFPLDLLRGMYPMPPNKYEWDIIVFKRYNQDLNSLYVNDVLVPALSLPQAFPMSSLVSVKFESNKPSDTVPDKNSASIYIEAIDTNGGVSNEAYINLIHTGVALLQSDFIQLAPYTYSRFDFDRGEMWANVLTYTTGPRPNINNTITSVVPITNSSGPDNTFNLITTLGAYTNVKMVIPTFNINLRTESNGNGKARARIVLRMDDGYNYRDLKEWGTADNENINVVVPAQEIILPSIATGKFIKLFFYFDFDNRRGSNSGSMDVELTISNLRTSISTTKSI